MNARIVFALALLLSCANYGCIDRRNTVCSSGENVTVNESHDGAYLLDGASYSQKELLAYLLQKRPKELLLIQTKAFHENDREQLEELIQFCRLHRLRLSLEGSVSRSFE